MAVPNWWRTKKQRYSLQGETCPACSLAVFPPREICPHCGLSMHRDTRGNTQHNLYDFALILLPAPVAAMAQASVVISGDD